jgi:GNAT superfamily N-acetyltransferase
MGAFEPARAPIETLTPADATGVLPLSIAAGWNQVAADWRFMLDAGRAFGIRRDGAWFASALALPLGHRIWWISMLLVDQRYRRQGHGTRLLARCMAEIAAAGAAMGLDATEFGRPIYLPLGFRDAYPLTRWNTNARPLRAPPGVCLRAATAADLGAIAAYDEALSGLQRAHVLAALARRAPWLAHIAHTGKGRLAGYVLGRDGYRATHIGPVVADDPAIGRALIAAAARTGGGAIIDVPDQHDGIGAWLAAAGASPSRRFMRMVSGAACPPSANALAVAGPELA